jgi:hypothetical protein
MQNISFLAIYLFYLMPFYPNMSRDFDYKDQAIIFSFVFLITFFAFSD